MLQYAQNLKINYASSRIVLDPFRGTLVIYENLALEGLKGRYFM